MVWMRCNNLESHQGSHPCNFELLFFHAWYSPILWLDSDLLLLILTQTLLKMSEGLDFFCSWSCCIFPMHYSFCSIDACIFCFIANIPCFNKCFAWHPIFLKVIIPKEVLFLDIFNVFAFSIYDISDIQHSFGQNLISRKNSKNIQHIFVIANLIFFYWSSKGPFSF